MVKGCQGSSKLMEITDECIPEIDSDIKISIYILLDGISGHQSFEDTPDRNGSTHIVAAADRYFRSGQVTLSN